MVYLIIVKLEKEKFWLGTTKKLGSFLRRLFNNKGPKWCRIYQPLDVIHCSEIDSDCKNHINKIIRISTFKLAALFGWNNIRSNRFSYTYDDYPISWDEHIKNYKPADPSKFKPLEHNLLDKLLMEACIKREQYFENKL